MSARWMPAAGLAVALIASGCGGDDDDGDGGGEPLTKEEFISQADAICAAGDREIDARSKEVFDQAQQKQPSPAELTDFATTILVPGIQKQIDEVGELVPPEEEQAKVDDFLNTAQEALDRVEADPKAAFDGPDPFTESRQLATEIGLAKCAQG